MHVCVCVYVCLCVHLSGGNNAKSSYGTSNRHGVSEFCSVYLFSKYFLFLISKPCFHFVPILLQLLLVYSQDFPEIMRIKKRTLLIYPERDKGGGRIGNRQNNIKVLNKIGLGGIITKVS